MPSSWYHQVISSHGIDSMKLGCYRHSREWFSLTCNFSMLSNTCHCIYNTTTPPPPPRKKKISPKGLIKHIQFWIPLIGQIKCDSSLWLKHDVIDKEVRVFLCILFDYMYLTLQMPDLYIHEIQTWSSLCLQRPSAGTFLTTNLQCFLCSFCGYLWFLIGCNYFSMP